MNAGFEDIFVLSEIIGKHGNDWETIFKQYQETRKPDADAIAELSYRNFLEMSMKTADPLFLLQKKIEKKFAENHPDKWIPVYWRVTFSDRPYSEALALGDTQEEIMREIMKMPDIHENWDSEEVELKMLELLAKHERASILL